ncbi:MAG: VanW family protein, partial [Defluviitaleaceae bacterium]|nr:VanW family protein [Defluviitaleaceae bacterium]
MGTRRIVRRRRRRRMRGKLVVALLITALIAIVAAGIVTASTSLQQYADMKDVVNYDKIYDNIYINGTNVGGLTKAQALAKISQKPQQDLSGKTITVVSGDVSLELKLSDYAAKYDYQPAVDTAWDYARTGALSDRYAKINALKSQPYKITYDPTYSFDQTGLESKIEDMAQQLYIAPVDATITRANGQFSFTPEQAGRQMDIDATAAAVKDLLTAGQGGTVTATMQTLEPAYTVDQLKQATSLLGTASTTYKEGANGRNTNLDVAANKINDQTVNPGDVFSTNAAMGPSTEANGWVNAPTYENGKVVDGIGGGMCQISSTLYD